MGREYRKDDRVEIQEGQVYRKTGRNGGIVEIVRINRNHPTGFPMAFCRSNDENRQGLQQYEQPVGEIRHLVTSGRLVLEGE